MTALRAIPRFALFERVVMRVLFAWLVWQATPGALIVNGIPSPNGMTRLFDLRFLLYPDVFAIARMALGVALTLYVLRLLVWLALPVAFFVQASANAITNSQGAIQHAVQIVSLVLLAQTAAHFYGLWRRHSEKEERDLLEDRAIWWSQQTLVAVYLVAGITKLFVSKGLWIFQARWIGVSIAKSAYQSFYDVFESDRPAATACRGRVCRRAWLGGRINRRSRAPSRTRITAHVMEPRQCRRARRAPHLFSSRAPLLDAPDVHL